jgi:hypothetical protein
VVGEVAALADVDTLAPQVEQALKDRAAS